MAICRLVLDWRLVAAWCTNGRFATDRTLENYCLGLANLAGRVHVQARKEKVNQY